MRRWINIKLVGWAEKIMRRIAEDQMHADTTKKMARDIAFDIGTVRRIITT